MCAPKTQSHSALVTAAVGRSLGSLILSDVVTAVPDERPSF
jgi:hypothetical protein